MSPLTAHSLRPRSPNVGAGLDGEVDAVEGDDLAVALVQPFGDDGVVGHVATLGAR